MDARRAYVDAWCLARGGVKCHTVSEHGIEQTYYHEVPLVLLVVSEAEAEAEQPPTGPHEGVGQTTYAHRLLVCINDILLYQHLR